MGVRNLWEVPMEGSHKCISFNFGSFVNHSATSYHAPTAFPGMFRSFPENIQANATSMILKYGMTASCTEFQNSSSTITLSCGDT
jgi:hypothetical protein